VPPSVISSQTIPKLPVLKISQILQDLRPIIRWTWVLRFLAIAFLVAIDQQSTQDQCKDALADGAGKDGLDAGLVDWGFTGEEGLGT
jgi:hypothetical protein